MELLGDLAMVDSQGNQVSKASTQAQISQAHALRAGIERSEFQRAQFCLQRAQRAHSQQPVVTLPADFEQAITRLISSASQNRYPSLEKSPQIPSLFQRVLSELNSVHGTSQDDGQTLPRLGEQEPHNSIIGDDYAMTECGGYLSSIQKPWSTFSPGGARSTIENCTNQQPPRETNTADDHALIGGFDTETVIHNPLPQSDAMGIFPGSFTGLPTGLSITESSVDSPGMSTALFSDRHLISPQVQGRQTMPPEPVVRLPTSCNPTLVKKQSIVSFQLPPDVSSTSSAALNMDDCIPSSPEDCKWSLSGQNDYNMASGGQDSMSIQGVSAPPVSDQILVDPLVPDAARGSQFQPVTSIDPLAQWKRVGVLDNNSSSLNRNPNDLGHLTGQVSSTIHWLFSYV
jgi:hypothetical protein